MAIDTANRQSVLKNITSAEEAARKGYSDAQEKMKSGLSSLLSGDALARQKYADAQEKMKSGLAALLGGDPSASTAKIRGYGNQVYDIGREMKPLATNIKDLGGEIAGIGSDINASGAGILGLGSDILSMNRDSSSPLVQALLGLYDSYSPDRLASMAGQDVANQFDVARGQQQRNLSRAGVNPTSGRYATLEQQMNTALATAKAAAKTRASMFGLDKQASFLTDTLGGLGRQLVNQGVSAQAQGASVIGNAVGAYQTAAGILSNAASIFSSAASLEGSAANMDLGFAKDVTAQHNAMAQMDTAEAAYHSNFAKDVTAQHNAMAQMDVATANYYGNLFSELLSYDAQQQQLEAQERARIAANSSPTGFDSYTDIGGNKLLWNGNQWQSFSKTDAGYVPLTNR